MSRLYRANQYTAVPLIVPGSIAGGPPNTGQSGILNFRDRPYNGVEWNVDSFSVDFSISNLIGAVEQVTANIIASGVQAATVDLTQTKLDATNIYFSGTSTPSQTLILRYTDSLSFSLSLTTAPTVAGTFPFATTLSIFGELSEPPQA